MKKLQQTVFRGNTLLLCLFVMATYGQKESKTYRESFNVGEDAVIDINTSYADIEFQTWDKNEVVMEATVELEGATSKEAEEYFKNGGVKILGNSKTIEISTTADNSLFFGNSFGDVAMGDFIIEIPELPELEPLFLDLEIPEMPELPEMREMPPMPPMYFHNFDYEAYKKDGEKYMKKWKKEFDENFDEDYKKRLAEWSERMKERSEAWRERVEEREERRHEMLQERGRALKDRQQAMKERQEVIKERQKVLEDRNRERMLRRKALDSTRFLFMERDSLHGGSNIFFGPSMHGNKKYRVKKIIKIKMPKSTKLKMNVRHGEVKLAENTKNINATLSYARLLATTIDGDKTNIVASYSPVSVQYWDNGSLNANFSENVALKDVKLLALSANSSKVTIDRLLDKAHIINNLGVLRINGVSKNFKGLDISVQNGELNCELPSSPYTIFVNGTSSKLSSPAYLIWDIKTNQGNTVQKSYHLDKNTDRSIVITSKYSDVVLEK